VKGRPTRELGSVHRSGSLPSDASVESYHPRDWEVFHPAVALARSAAATLEIPRASMTPPLRAPEPIVGPPPARVRKIPAAGIPGFSVIERGRYCLITLGRAATRRPVSLAARLDAVAARSRVPPALWVLVDDGSWDETPAILAEYAKRVPWIRIAPPGGPRRPEARRRRHRRVLRGLRDDRPASFGLRLQARPRSRLPPRYFETLIGTDGGEPEDRDLLWEGVLPPRRGGPSLRHDSPSRIHARIVSEKIGDDHSLGSGEVLPPRPDFLQIGRRSSAS
jgi:hypothetical protein